MNIVAVDNNPHDLSLLKHEITKLLPDSQIQTFTDPLMSAKYVCNNPVNMAFLVDVMKPADGFKLLRVLRANVPNLPVVMVLTNSKNKECTMDLGVNGFVLKPVSAARLGGVLTGLLL